jgi:hypothetical protein
MNEDLAREQGAALAAMLGQSAGQGGTGAKGGTRPPTRAERELLTALAADPGKTWRPSLLIRDQPAVFGHRQPAGLHQTAHSLVRKGLARRRKTSQRVGYQATAAGLAALARDNETRERP